MTLRRRGYLVEEIIGIPWSKFKVGKTMVLERGVLYAHNYGSSKMRVTRKVISHAEPTSDGKALFIETKDGFGFRSAGIHGQHQVVSSITGSKGGKRLVSYEVIDVE